MSRALSPKEKQYMRYWTQFCAYLEQQGSQLRSGRALTSHYIDFRIDIPRCYVRARRVIRPSEMMVMFVMSGPAKGYFPSLAERKTEIESEFGESLRWWHSEKRTESHIYLRREYLDPLGEADWHQEHEWLATKLEKLDEVFRPRIKKLR